ncbi:MAG: hypothetical protein JSS87_00965 [Acidobacteria bacterium]|nr:hypothetical protein [Acidobacteriota bacterium]
MQTVMDGQCGLCTHFGEPHGGNDKLVTIVQSHKADEHIVDECGHPKHASLHLKVTPISGCDGFQPAKAA